MTNQQVVARRLRGTLLARTACATGADVVRALGAVQAQDFPGAKWALGQRLTRATDASIQKEVDSGKILRTHVLRPTWHFVAPEDIRWLLALTGERVNRTMGYYNTEFGLDAKVYARGRDLMTSALEGGKALTRQELRAVMEPKIGTLAGQRLARVVMHAECVGLICSGPMRGKQFTYSLLEERARPVTAPERDEALERLALRYFTTRGPATAHDAAWWSGLTLADVRRSIEIAGDRLERVEIEGRAYWIGAGSRDAKMSASAHLLPNYDEFFIGYKDRGAIGQRLRSVKAVTGGNALIAHVVAVDGQLVGGWRRVVERGTIGVKLDLLTRLTPAERKLVDAAIERHRRFVETA